METMFFQSCLHVFDHTKHMLANFLIFVASSEEYQDVSTVASVERKSEREYKISEMNLCPIQYA